MAKILLIAAIIVTLGTAGLGFLTKGKVDGLNTELMTSKDEANRSRTDASNARAETAKKEKELTEANKAVEEGKTALVTAQGELTAAKGDAEKAKADVADKEKQLAEVKTQLEGMKDPKAPSAPTDDPRIALLQAEKAEVEKQLAEQRQVADTLKGREQEAQEKYAQAQQEIQRYRAPITRAGISGRVTAVNPGWNFVVINVGDNRGASVNAPLIVMRSGQMVARLRITSVEPTSSIADVVPGSMARGQNVQPGDTVVFAGRAQAPVAPEPPAGGGAPANPALPQGGQQASQ